MGPVELAFSCLKKVAELTLVDGRYNYSIHGGYYVRTSDFGDFGDFKLVAGAAITILKNDGVKVNGKADIPLWKIKKADRMGPPR